MAKDSQLKGQLDLFIKNEKLNFHGFYNNHLKSYNGTFGYHHDNPGMERIFFL